MMRDDAVLLEHSVEADVSLAFAWMFRTDVANWDDPPAKFELNGPFVVGAQGTTLIPGEPPLRWRISEVIPQRLFVIEMQLDRAALSFEWQFDAVSEHRTRLTQRIRLTGSNAAAFVRQVKAGFGPTLPDGMDRIAAHIVAAERDATMQSQSGYEALLRLIENKTQPRRS